MKINSIGLQIRSLRIYSIHAKNCSEIIAILHEKKAPATIHYPIISLYQQLFFDYLNSQINNYSITEKASSENYKYYNESLLQSSENISSSTFSIQYKKSLAH